MKIIVEIEVETPADQKTSIDQFCEALHQRIAEPPLFWKDGANSINTAKLSVCCVVSPEQNAALYASGVTGFLAAQRKIESLNAELAKVPATALVDPIKHFSDWLSADLAADHGRDRKLWPESVRDKFYQMTGMFCVYLKDTQKA